MTPDFPARIGPYDIVGVLASDHLGTVYKAFDQAHARVVSVRALSPELLSDALRLDRFRRDVKASAALIHENVVRTYGELQDGDLVCTVTEYIEGGGLADRLHDARLMPAEAIRVLHGVADGVAAAHRAGIVHGDLNPRHVLVSKDLSVVKVGGFGSAGAAPPRDAARTAALAVERVSSELYRAPELAGGGTASERSDIYSLGVMAYEAMTGKLPIGKFSLPSDVNSQVPLTLDPIVLKCLATDPSQRYQTVAALVADLDKLEEVVDFRLLSEVRRLSGGRLFGSKQGTAHRANRPGRPPKVLGVAALAIVLLTVAAAGVVWLLHGRWSVPPEASVAGATSAPSHPVPVPEAAAARSKEQAPVASAGLPGMLELATPMTASPPRSGMQIEPPTPQTSKPAPPSPGVATQAGPAGRAGVTSAAAAEPAKSAVAPPPVKPVRPGDLQRDAGHLFTEAQSLIKKGKDADARAKLALIGEAYWASRYFVPAMMVKIDIEDRLALREPDSVIGRAVPASVRTKQLLAERAPQHPTAEAALWQLGEFYAGIQQYAAAVQAYEQLATRFPNTRLDAWFRAGEITEQRLKKREDARAAYLSVPATSPRFAEAQERARKLAGR
jgi:serine/threonine protein kinase